MEDIAEAADVSRRTLFRQFPSKADLVWDELTSVLDGFDARLVSVEANSLSELFEFVIAPTLKWLDEPRIAQLARRRLRLIAANPSLLTHPRLSQVHREVIRLVSRVEKLEAPAELIGRSIVSVGFGALLWWAESDTSLSALESFRVAIRGLIPITKPKR